MSGGTLDLRLAWARTRAMLVVTERDGRPQAEALPSARCRARRREASSRSTSAPASDTDDFTQPRANAGREAC